MIQELKLTENNFLEPPQKYPRSKTTRAVSNTMEDRKMRSTTGGPALDESDYFHYSHTQTFDNIKMPDNGLRNSNYYEPMSDMHNQSYYCTELPYANSESSMFSVSDPIKGNPVTYIVRGFDMEGEFEISRRYNDFFSLRAALVSRWPGIYIPPIPPKKTSANKDEKYLKERRIFLEKFIRTIGENEFLTQSEEFKIFSRTSGNI